MKNEFTKKVLSDLIQANRDILEAVRLQQEMISDLKTYVEKRDEQIKELLDRLTTIYEK